MKPSLFSLFQRSEYHGTSASEDAEGEDSEALERRWNQRERFAVAAIAYCLENELDFRSHFLRKICDAAPEDVSRRFDILIEDKFWGDLVLMTKSAGAAPKVYVVECKINARLQDHQNPSKDTFWREGGYGWNIRDSFPDDRTALHYVVLGYERTLPSRKGSRIRWWQKNWEHLDGFSGSSMIADLYSSLGNLDVVRFRSRMTNSMKTATQAKNACEIYAVLRSVNDSLGLGKEKFSLDTTYESDGDMWSVGMIIFRKQGVDLQTNLGKLQQAVKPTQRQIGWFGYQQTDPQIGPCFAARFFCGKGAEKALENLLKKNSTTRGYVTLHNDNAVEVQMPKSAAERMIRKGDKEWFVKVIKAAFEG